MDGLQLLAFALPLIIGALLALRLARVVRGVRMLHRPEQLGRMLSDEVRQQLEVAGLDPDDLDAAKLRALEEHPELHERVREELRTALGRILAGRAPRPAAPSFGGPEVAMTAPDAWSRPGPIDPPAPGHGRRWGAALVLATLFVCCALLLQR